MSFYEYVFVARQDLSNQQVDALTADFTKLVEDNGGKVAKTESWGLRSLAYKIKKNRKGHYVLLNLDAPAGAVAELERNTRLNEDVIRFMTIKVDELEEGPSAVVRSKGSRDDHGPRRDDRGPRRDDRGPRRDDRGPRRDDRGDRGERNEGART